MIHVSKNEASDDNETCGRLEQPCFTFSYAHAIAVQGDTIALDRSYEYKHIGSIDVTDGDLELTSYCVNVSCTGKQMALINIEDSKDSIFYITSSSYLKISQLHLKAHRNCFLSSFFYLNEGISSIELHDSILTPGNPYSPLTFVMISNPSVDRFKLIQFHNVIFGFDKIFEKSSSMKSKSFDVANHHKKLLKSKTFMVGDAASSRPRMFRGQRYDSAISKIFTTIKITSTIIQNVDIRLSIGYKHGNEANIFLHKNTLIKTVLRFDLSVKSNLSISYGEHRESRVRIVGDGSGLESTISISHLVSTCSGYRCCRGPVPESSDYQLDISMKNMFGGNIHLDKCSFGSSASGGVSITNASQVTISNSVFRDISVTDTDLLSTDRAVGLTLISNRATLSNNHFQDISALQNFPSSLYIQIVSTTNEQINSEITMTNLTVDTTTVQNWNDDLAWYLKVNSKQITRNNVTVRCLKGDQRIERTIEKDREVTVRCTRCSTSSYNVLPPTMKWEQNVRYEYNNVCHKPCPYQASCDNGLKSRGNYWGLVNTDNSTTQGTVFFHLCPTYYCCSSKADCTSYNTCANNRRGRLCGDCISNHSVALFGPNQCVLTADCKPKTAFWIGYMFCILAVYFLILFYRDAFFFIGKLLSKIYKRLNRGSLQKRSRNGGRSSVFEPLLEDEGQTDKNVEVGYTEHAYVSIQISGLIKLAFFFYQVASIIRIEASAKMNYDPSYLMEALTSFFNIQMSSAISSLSNVCPLTTNNIYLVELMRVSIILWCLVLLLVSLLILSLLNVRRSNHFSTNRIDKARRTLVKRVKAGIVQLLLLGFSSISSISFSSVHCININGKGLFLYMQAASVECYQPWQIAVFVFVGGWVVLFPLTLYIGTSMLSSKRMSPNWFLASLLFPPSIIVFFLVNKSWRTLSNSGEDYRRRRLSGSSYNGIDTNTTAGDDSIIGQTTNGDIGDTERSDILLIVNEPFKVIDHTSEQKEEDEDNFTFESNHQQHPRRNLIWEPILLYRRLILLSASIFIINPMLKLYPIGVLLALFGIHDYMVKPFSKQTNLNLVQAVSSVLLGVLALINTFWAFSNNFDLTSVDSTFHTLGSIFLYIELVVLLCPFILFVCWLLYHAFRKLYKLFLYKQD